MNRFATRELSMLVALVAIWAFFAWQEPVFLSARNLSLLSVELAVTAVLALGMLVVLLPGQIDLSAGSGVGLAGAVAAVLVFWHDVPAPRGAADRDARRGAGVVGDGCADRDRAHSRLHHDARRPAGLPRPALARDREPDRAGRRGRQRERVLAADHLLPARRRRLRAGDARRRRHRRVGTAMRASAGSPTGFAVDDRRTHVPQAVRPGAARVPRRHRHQRLPRRADRAGDPRPGGSHDPSAGARTRRSAATCTRSAATRRRRRCRACRCATRSSAPSR